MLYFKILIKNDNDNDGAIDLVGNDIGDSVCNDDILTIYNQVGYILSITIQYQYDYINGSVATLWEEGRGDWNYGTLCFENGYIQKNQLTVLCGTYGMDGCWRCTPISRMQLLHARIMWHWCQRW